MVRAVPADVDVVDSESVVGGLWDDFGFPRDTYYDRAVKHARILKGYYIDFLSELTDLSDEDIRECYSLYLSSYFLDDALDSDHRPYALAVGMKLYVRFVEFVNRKYPDKRLLLDTMYNLQMRYQTATLYSLPSQAITPRHCSRTGRSRASMLKVRSLLYLRDSPVQRSTSSFLNTR